MSVVQTKRVERQGNNGGYGVAERARGVATGLGLSTFQQPLTASRLVWITIPPRHESHPVKTTQLELIVIKSSLVKTVKLKLLNETMGLSRHADNNKEANNIHDKLASRQLPKPGRVGTRHSCAELNAYNCTITGSVSGVFSK